MARLKRGSNILETARRRLTGLKSITPAPDFGPALGLVDYEREVDALGAAFDKYNQTLTVLDGLQNDLDDREARLRELNRRMLAAAEAAYGPNSNEYEAAGGTRAADRKPPSPKKPDAA